MPTWISLRRIPWSCRLLFFLYLLGCRQSDPPPTPNAIIPFDTSLAGLTKAIQHPKKWIRARAIMALPAHGPAGLPILLKGLEKPDETLHFGVVLGLEKIGTPAIPHLFKLLKHTSRGIQARAAEGIHALFPQLSDEAPRRSHWRKAMVQALSDTSNPSVHRHFHQILCKEKPDATEIQKAAFAAMENKLRAQPSRTRASSQPSHSQLQKSLLEFARSGLSSPVVRLIELLSCRQPLAAQIQAKMAALAPQLPLTTAFLVMRLYKKPSTTVASAWLLWLQQEAPAFVVLALDQMWGLKVPPTDALRKQIHTLLLRGKPGQQWRAMRLLGQWGQRKGLHPSLLTSALKAANPRLQYAAAIALARQKRPLQELLQALQHMLHNAHPTAQAGALLALGEAARFASFQVTPNAETADSTTVLKRLQLSLNASYAGVREASTKALGQWALAGSPQAARLLMLALVDRDVDVREVAVIAMGRLTRHVRIAVLGLTQALRDKEPLIRKLAARGLGQMGLQGAPALDALAQATHKEQDYLAKQALTQATQRILHALRKQPAQR